MWATLWMGCGGIVPELDTKALWRRVLDAISGRIAAPTVDAWLRPLTVLDAAPTSESGGVLLVGAPNAFVCDWVSRHYGPLLEETVSSLLGGRWTLHWTATPAAEESELELQAKFTKLSAVGVSAIHDGVATSNPFLTFGAQPSLPGTGRDSARPQPPVPSVRRPPSVPPPRRAVAPRRAAVDVPAPGALRYGGRAVACGLSPKYTFEQFVSGPSNQFAHATAVAAAQATGRRFNPLFLCGGTGLGKTHLINAVGHRLIEEKPDARIVYVSAEHFTNEFIASLQSHTMDEFRARYRNECDALLLDDVQFLAGREQTQEEFFHTFNVLYMQDKPIVLTSDVLPHDLKGMAERMVSRFSSGLVAEIYPPEMETRVAIIRKKAELEGIHVDDEAAFLLASSVASNVRDLEGMLMKLAIKASLSKRSSVDAELVRENLRLPLRPGVLTVEDVQRIVGEHYRVKVSQLTGRERHQGITLPRQVAMYLAREFLGVSFPQIGHRFGGKDHTTVMAAVQKIKRLLATGAPVTRDIDLLLARLGPAPRRA